MDVENLSLRHDGGADGRSADGHLDTAGLQELDQVLVAADLADAINLDFHLTVGFLGHQVGKVMSVQVLGAAGSFFVGEFDDDLLTVVLLGSV